MPLNSPKRPPYWNSTSGFDFGHITAVDMSFCTNLQNFIQIGLPWAEKIMSYQFSRWRISTVLNFRGPIMGSLKSRCTTSYRSSIDTIALNCLVFEKLHFCIFATHRQTYRRTDGQARCMKLLSLLRAAAYKLPKKRQWERETNTAYCLLAKHGDISIVKMAAVRHLGIIFPPYKTTHKVSVAGCSCLSNFMSIWYRSEDIAIWIFRTFGSRCLFSPQKWGSWGLWTPKCDYSSSRPPKGTSLYKSASFTLSTVKIRWGVWPVGELAETLTDTQTHR